MIISVRRGELFSLLVKTTQTFRLRPEPSTYTHTRARYTCLCLVETRRCSLLQDHSSCAYSSSSSITNGFTNVSSVKVNDENADS